MCFLCLFFLQKWKQVFISSYLEWSQKEICRHPLHWLDDPKLCFLVSGWFPIRERETRGENSIFLIVVMILQEKISLSIYIVYVFQLVFFLKNIFFSKISCSYRYFVSYKATEGHFHITIHWYDIYSQYTTTYRLKILLLSSGEHKVSCMIAGKQHVFALSWVSASLSAVKVTLRVPGEGPGWWSCTLIKCGKVAALEQITVSVSQLRPESCIIHVTPKAREDSPPL